ncbi:MAG: DsbA family oxidoreductase [Bacteroidota bacterium]
MKVKVWSDVMCPFCYIGKRRLELALQQFPGKDSVKIEWKSFQLDPESVTQPDKSVNEYLAERKGWTVENARQMNDYVTQMAREAGLQYDFDKAVIANSFDAHRLSHFAKKHGLQDAMEERLFRAYFTEGKNTADHETLVQLAVEVGLKGDDVRQMLGGDDFADEVRNDVYEAHQIGVQGVPFFVFNDKYAVSGAQPTEIFLQALNRASQQ